MQRDNVLPRWRWYLIFGLSIALLLIHYVPYFLSGGPVWGFNHLAFLPDIMPIFFGGLGFLALLMFLPPADRLAGWAYRGAARICFGSSNNFRWFVIAVAALLLFWFCRMPTNLLGNGYTVLLNIGGELSTIFTWTKSGATGIAYFLAQLLPYSGLDSAEYAYTIMSIISGSVTVFFFLGIACELAQSQSTRLMIFCLLMFSGWTLLFFGYIENYSIMWPFMTGYIYYSLKYLKGKGNLLLPTLFMVLAMVMHLEALFILGSYLPLIFARGIGDRLYRRYTPVIWIIMTLLLVIGGSIFLYIYKNSVRLQEHHVIALTVHYARTPGYTLFSMTHLLDIVNEFLLLIPILPALLVLGWSKPRRLINDAPGVFLFFLAAGGLAFMLIIDPGLGMGRDWDLFAPFGLGLLLLLARNLPDGKSKAHRLFPGLTFLSLVLILPYFLVNHDRPRSIEYLTYLLRLDHHRSTSGIAMLQNYYYDQGNYAKSDSLARELIQSRPFIQRAREAYKLAQAGKLKDALELADSLVAAYPHEVPLYSLRGIILLEKGDNDRAIADFEHVYQAGRVDHLNFTNLATAYYNTGNIDLAIKNLRKAQQRAPNFRDMHEGFARMYFQLEQFDSAFVYSHNLIRIDSLHEKGYFWTGVSAYELGNYDQAEGYLNQYLQRFPDGEDKVAAMKILHELE
jgi:tetratricopeptide (TPR) repeat protein